MFRINLLKGFLYPLTSIPRLLAACLVMPLSLLVTLGPILLGLGVLGTGKLNFQEGLGFSLLVGFICILVGAIPFTFLAGYTLRCRKRVIAGETTLPTWSGWSDLVRDGGDMDALAFMIGVPTLALFWGGVASLAGPITYLFQARTWQAAFLALLGSSAGIVCLLGALCMWLIVMLFLPMATLRLALGKGPIQALAPRGLLGDIRKGWFDYLVCCLLVGALSIAFSAAQASFPPLVVVSFPVQVYLQLVWSYLLGGYAKAYLADQIDPTCVAQTESK